MGNTAPKFRSIAAESGEVEDLFFADSLDAGVALIRQPVAQKSPRNRQLKVLVRQYGGTAAAGRGAPGLDATLWRAILLALQAERHSVWLLPPSIRRVVANMVYNVVSFLLGAVDRLVAIHPGDPFPDESLKQLEGVVTSAVTELDRLERYVRRAVIATAFKYYLAGLPLGALIVCAIVATIELTTPSGSGFLNFSLTLAAGAIGSIVSVMSRLTRGHSVSVDVAEGRVLTLAGAFRPIVGATLSLLPYFLIETNLLPLAFTDTNQQYFYANLAFLAGFSERWAQDTLVRTATVPTAEFATQAKRSPMDVEPRGEPRRRNC